MPLEIVTVPCRSDNYAYLLHDPKSGETALVDAPSAGPIQAELKSRGWKLDQILITHHHFDHVDGVEALRNEYGASVVGARADAHRLPRLDKLLDDGDSLEACGQTALVWDVSGHTVGHIAYIFPGAAFTADSLMALGCGRVFEGTFPMMWASLQKLSSLPPETMIYSGHEYTMSNARFALTIEPGNADLSRRAKSIAERRAKSLFTVPESLSIELATNPFLRANLPEVKALVGMPDATDAEVFGEIRTRKDRF